MRYIVFISLCALFIQCQSGVEFKGGYDYKEKVIINDYNDSLSNAIEQDTSLIIQSTKVGVIIKDTFCKIK